MAKNDQQEAFERALSATLSRVIDFLKFAEAKNAALLTFASAWIIGSINFLTSGRGLPCEWRAAFIAALPMFALAALISLFSFFPRTLLTKFHKDPDQSRALLYFGDAALFAPAAYRERVRERYYPAEGETATRNYLDDIAIQIAVNSQITARKLRLFHVAAAVVCIAIIILLVPAVTAVVELWHEYQAT